MEGPVSGPTRVLIVDDHQMFADALVALLEIESDVEVVGSVRTGEDALLVCGPSRPDVILMDIDLPGMDGIQATKAVLRVCPDAKVVGISAMRDRRLLARAVAAGASGFVPKTRAAEELVRAVRAAAAGEMVVPEGDLAPVLEALRNAAERSADVGARVASLTSREVAVLQAFADGLTTDEVAERFVITARTVRSHVENTLAKLGVHSKLDAVLLALRAGVIRLDETEETLLRDRPDDRDQRRYA
jgi:DNA-binding NarL/FixJ family response regulator